MNQKQIGLRLLLEGGHFVQVILPEAIAEGYVDRWIKGMLKGVIGESVPTPHNPVWAVDTASIKAMHTFDPALMQQAQPFQPSNPPTVFRRSGIA